MKAFRFQLEAVLTLREQAEQAAQQQCARAIAALECAQARVQALEAMIAAHDEVHREQLATGVRSDRLQQLRAYALSLRERRTQLARELAEAQGVFAAASRQLVSATQRRQLLERLRERKHRAHQYRIAQLEQKLLDDFGASHPNLLQPSL